MEATANPTMSERQWAALAHAGALLLALLTSWFSGFAGMLAAIVVYLLRKDDSAFVADHAREAFNFNLSMFLYACALIVAGIVLFGATVLTLGLGIILTLPAGLVLLAAAAAVAVMWLVCSIIAVVKAWNGESWRYPLTIRLLAG